MFVYLVACILVHNVHPSSPPKAALDYITSHPDLKDTKIVVYGQSIGGAVAVALTAANEDKIHALIIENTFTSLVTRRK